MSLQVSWGTKGSDKAEVLPSVSSKKTKDADSPAVEDTMKVQEDVDAAFKETVTRAITKVETKEVVEKPTMDDQNKTFRTRLVSLWMLSNATLAIAIENINGLPSSNPNVDEQALENKQHTYFGFILYSTFGLAAVRFTGVSACCCEKSHSDRCAVYVLLFQAESFPILQEELTYYHSRSITWTLFSLNSFHCRLRNHTI